MRDFLVAPDENLDRENHVRKMIGNFLRHVARHGHHHLVGQIAVLGRITAVFREMSLNASLPVCRFADSINLPVLES